MKGIKLDRYAIYEKGREYEVLVFPFIKYMWVFDGGPAEDGLYISGSEYSYSVSAARRGGNVRAELPSGTVPSGAPIPEIPVGEN